MFMDEEKWLGLCKERLNRIKASPSDEDDGFIKIFATMLPKGVDVSNPDFILDELIMMPFLSQKLCLSMFCCDDEIYEVVEQEELAKFETLECAERNAVQAILTRFSDQQFPLITSYEQFTPRAKN